MTESCEPNEVEALGKIEDLGTLDSACRDAGTGRGDEGNPRGEGTGGSRLGAPLGLVSRLPCLPGSMAIGPLTINPVLPHLNGVRKPNAAGCKGPGPRDR